MSSVKTRRVDALSYFNQDDLPAKVFLDKYALRNKEGKILENNPDEMHWRIAKEIARVEKKKFRKPFSAQQVFRLIRDFKYLIPQGGSMFGIGNPSYVTLSNCYVVTPPHDSYAGIHYTDEQITQISKRRGGTGTDISALRPIGMPTKNSSRFTTGIIPFAQRFSNTIREVGQDGRRGALMLTLSVHHPEVVSFAEAKLDRTKITGANLSIRLTNEFLNAVENDTDYEQRWPVDSCSPEISRKVNAREVWNKIVTMAHAMAEPGLLFWDRIIEESPADCYVEQGFRTVSTNPCSELPLCILDSCRLLLLNLFSFVANPFTSSAKFLWEKFHRFVMYAQRIMDDIIDLELECIGRIIEKIKADPEPEFIKQRELELWHNVYKTCANGRRTGTGITGLGDTIAALGMAYGSQDSVGFTDNVYRTLKLGAYRASVEMAKELGPFPVWNPEQEEGHPYLSRIKEDDNKLFNEMNKYGRRNIALLTTPPAGTTSIVAGPGPYYGNTSGFEPLFMMEFMRNKKIAPSDINARVDYIDDTGDRWQQFSVIHPKLRLWMDITGEKDIRKSPYNGSCAEEIDWQKRVHMQGVAQVHVDHAISSTINLPEDATVEDVGTIYRTAWKDDCKGMTVYRKNCRTGVLVEKKTCPNCHSENIVVKDGKCSTCHSCGWSACSL